MFENNGWDFWFIFIFFGFIVMLPLSIWKMVDIILWVIKNIHIVVK